MNCKKCGTKLPGYAKYCLNCGEKVNLDKAAAGEVDESVGIEEQPWEEYEDMYQKVLDGTLVVDDDFSKLETTEWSNLNLNII